MAQSSRERCNTVCRGIRTRLYQKGVSTVAVGLLTIELYLPVNASLKGKRGILKPLIARLRRDFNVSVCEADAQDMLSRAVLEVACVSQNSALAQRHLQMVANRVEKWRLDAQLVDYWIEILG